MVFDLYLTSVRRCAIYQQGLRGGVCAKSGSIAHNQHNKILHPIVQIKITEGVVPHYSINLKININAFIFSLISLIWFLRGEMNGNYITII